MLETTVATPTEPRLELAPYDLGAALRLAEALGVGHGLAQVLVRRGLADPTVARAFLAAEESHPPESIGGMAAAVALVREHVERGSRIVVHGDYDVDGVCATAIAVRALRALGADAGWYLPSRLEDGYGLQPATAEWLAARGTGLLVTVDCGVTAIEAVAVAQAGGTDVVVTDHHAPRADGRLPDAPLVHPGLGRAPFPELCGTAVAWKLARALGAPTVAGEGELELVALATVADLVPLTGENRTLVRAGLRRLAVTASPGLRALMAVARVDPSALDAGALGFRLAPRINAAGRLRRADAGLELLLTESAERAREIAQELDLVNGERRAIEEAMTWEAEAQVAEQGLRGAYVLASERWHPGVVGIVASRIVERFHRPAILIALPPASAGPGATGSGSGRSIPGFDLLAGLHACAGPLERYGGHRAAAGLTVAPAALDDFRAAFEAHAEAVLTPELLTPCERVDAVVSGGQLDLALAEELARLEPCGMGNPAPRLLVPGARCTDVRTMGEGGRHARFTLRSGTGHARAVAFGCGGRPSPGEDVPVDVTVKLELNVWNGAVEPRAVLRRARPCGEGEIEVVGEAPDFLTGAFAELNAPRSVPPPGGTPNGEPDFRGPGASPPGETPSAGTQSQHRILDRRSEGPLAVLADAAAAGGTVLAVCADVPRRLPGLRERTGGFRLAAYAALERRPELLDGVTHVVALDPPTGPAAAAALRGGPATRFTHLAWGEAELRFAMQMHELEYALKAPLAALFRGLRALGEAAGDELELLLRGGGRPGLPDRVAGRLVRVLGELGLVSIDRGRPALALASTAPTALERSAAYTDYQHRLEEGRRYLSRATGPQSPR